MIAIKSTWNVTHRELDCGRISVGHVARVVERSAPRRTGVQDLRLTMGVRREQILAALREHVASVGGWRQHDLAKRIGITANALAYHLHKLASEGLVTNVSHGRWRAA